MPGWGYCGLRLRPDSARRALDEQPTIGVRKQMVRLGALEPVWKDLEALLNGDTDWERSVSFFADGPASDDDIALAVDSLIVSGGTFPIAALARAATLSERQFRRRFREVTGVAPKAYADVQRLRRALILSLSDTSWAGVAEETGFADQPHLIREVQKRFGAAPREVRGYLGTIRHELLSFDDVRIIQAQWARAA